MSAILGEIAKQLGPSILENLSSQLGAEQGQVQNAVGAALPMILGGLTRNAQQPGGAESLFGALQKDHMGEVNEGPLGGVLSSLLGGNSGASNGVESLMGAALQMLGGTQPSQTSSALNGAGILGHIFGSQQSRVQEQVANASGLNVVTIAKLLPVLAPVVMRVLGQQTQRQNLNASSLAGFLQHEETQVQPNVPSTSGLASLLDQDGDGSISDELMGIGSQLLSSGALSSLFK